VSYYCIHYLGEFFISALAVPKRVKTPTSSLAPLPARAKTGRLSAKKKFDDETVDSEAGGAKRRCGAHVIVAASG
jgi:hypothetical protein